MIIPLQYIWLAWSLLLLGVWAVLYVLLDSREKKREMLVVSFLTMPLGLTEPLFVPEYWLPPSLFDLAVRTGFDIESLVFSFAIGGVTAVLYEWSFRTRHLVIPALERQRSRHRFHKLALISGPALFAVLELTTTINPIYTAIIGLVAGGLFTMWCRPDLVRKMTVTAGIFTGLYFFYFQTLILTFPGYVERVWNVEALLGVFAVGVPIEELMFAASVGLLWSSMYEHFTWRMTTRK